MNIYNISCRSVGWTYFSAYLQNLTVIAENEDDAIAHAKQWMNDNRNWFIEKDPSKWRIEKMQDGLRAGVIDWHEDSDY